MKYNYNMKIEPSYVPRWIYKEHEAEIINLYHLAIAAGKKSRYERLLYASKEFSKKYDYVTSTGAYKDLDCMTQ